MNLVKWTPMREMKEIQTYLNRIFDDTPLRRIDDDDFSFADWLPPVDPRETDTEYLIKAELPEIRTEDAKKKD
jgi:HSP20 family protein